MTVEQLHDALTLLPADLVAEADKHRGKKRPPIHWQRYAAMAACFALLLCAGSFCMRLFGPKGRAKSEAPAEDMAQMAADTAAPGALCPGEGEPETAPAAEVPETAAPRDDGPEAEMSGDIGANSSMSAAKVLESPPMLSAVSGESAIDVSTANYTWEVPQENGMANAVTACGSAPTDFPEKLPLLETEDREAALRWAVPPDSVTLRYWTSDGDGWTEGILDTEAPEKTEDGDFLLRLPEGAEVCEVAAQWPQGTASYAFRVASN